MKKHLPVVSSSDAGNIRDPSRSVLADISWVHEPHSIAPHSHVRGQLIYATSGSLNIKSGGPVFVVPPQFAVWIPPGVTHSVTASQSIDYCSLFIDETSSDMMSMQSQLLHLTPLLKELTRTAAEDDHSCVTGAEERLNAVILDQLQLLQPTQVAVPVPSSERLYVMVEHFINNPAEGIDMTHWATRLSMSERTLARLFKKETGLTPVQWLHHLRVLKAIELLEGGESVKCVAFDVGYNQASAFISMFKKIAGHTPSTYAKKFTLH
ncbi:AraC family transcriptional regulator [Sulfuriflexus mobilis]|uniref:AraC family transcriptional regulator n=1 Tax=Sulfuriflexus mobilis TaxID=1811807 RepID=UPI000F81F944|nr:helix-turn-helix transcriptional regulator [Sulfuriflexus mobilis]